MKTENWGRIAAIVPRRPSRRAAAYTTADVFPSYLQVSLGVAQDLSRQPAFVACVLDNPIAIDPLTTLDAASFRFFHFDPTFAPKGKTAVTCFLPTYNGSYWTDLQRDDHARYVVEKQRIADAVIAMIERRIPGVRNAIEVIDVSTPASVCAPVAKYAAACPSDEVTIALRACQTGTNHVAGSASAARRRASSLRQ